MFLSLPVGLADEAKKPEADVPQGYDDAPDAGEDAQADADEAVDEIGGIVLDAANDQVDANVANLEKQLLPQFQPLLKAELSFVRKVCELDKEQSREVAKAGDECLMVAVRKYAVAQNRMMHGRILAREQPSMSDPRKLLQDGMAKVVTAKLRPDQAKQYQDELEKRMTSRKRMTVLGLVAKLDENLVLSIEQRDKLIVSLTANWRDGWAQSLQMLMYDQQHLPGIPDQLIVPILNDVQKSVWRGAQKQDHQFFWGGFGFQPNMVVVEDAVMEEEELEIDEQLDQPQAETR